MNRAERLDDGEEALRIALDGALAHTWVALPGIVTAANLDAQTVSVQPAITGTITSPDGAERSAPLPMLVDVPICWPRGGGFALTLPVKAGDECLVVFADRCIDAWWQEGGQGVPAERRKHDLSDGFAILAPTSQPKRLQGVSGNAVQLRNESGSAFVQIDENGDIELRGGKVTIQGIVFDTHKHGGVSPGSSKTTAPEN